MTITQEIRPMLSLVKTEARSNFLEYSDRSRGRTQTNNYQDQYEEPADDSYVNPQHIVGTDARGEKIILMPFPKPNEGKPSNNQRDEEYDDYQEDYDPRYQRQPDREPTRQPVREATRQPVREPVREPTKIPEDRSRKKKNQTQIPQDVPKKTMVQKNDDYDDAPPPVDSRKKKTMKPIINDHQENNLLDELENVDDNGNPYREPQVKDYEAENKPYQMFFNDDNRKAANKEQANQPPSPKKTRRCEIF
jgi:hypothetical protein